MGERSSQTSASSPAALDVRSQLAVVRKYWWFTAIVLAVALGATFFLTQRQERVYSASAQVLLRTSSTVERFPYAGTGPRELLRVPENEEMFADSPEFVALARTAAPSGVSVTTRMSGDQLVFTARGGDAADVAEAATTWAELYVAEQYRAFTSRTASDLQFLNDGILELRAERDAIRVDVAELEDRLEATTDSDEYARLLSQKVAIEALLQPRLGPIEQQIDAFTRQASDLELVARFHDEPLASARVERAARVPSTPISPDQTRNLAMGGMLGLALGLGAPYLRHLLDDKIDDDDDVEGVTRLPVLGSIPAFEEADEYEIEVIANAGEFSSSRYQTVLTAIEFAAVEAPVSTLLVTSAVPGEGKTTTAVNLAALASKYKSVLLIDGDMRRPAVHRYLGVESDAPGLAEVLRGEQDVFDVRKDFEHKGTSFDFLPAGHPVEDPAQLLRGDVWAKTLAELFLYDLIIIDAPPVLAVTDALLLGQAVDGQILVSRSGATRQDDLSDAGRLLASNNARTLGVVLNHERTGTRRHSYYQTYARKGERA